MQIATLLDKYAAPKKNDAPAVSLSQIESYFKQEFPPDYRDFLVQYNGFATFIGKEYVELWDVEALIENNKGYQIQKYLPSAIGIGSNCGGEMIAFDITLPPDFKVILTPFIGLDSPIEIGTSFTNFLLRLDNGQSWFGD